MILGVRPQLGAGPWNVHGCKSDIAGRASQLLDADSDVVDALALGKKKRRTRIVAEFPPPITL
jgi:hypothetical protein